MARADLLVDYHGTGFMQPAFHPTLPVTFNFGYIPLPDNVHLDREWPYYIDFKLPFPVWNPFLGVVSLNGMVEYSFQPRNEAAGEWTLILSGCVTRLKQKGVMNEEYAYSYKNPVDIIPEVNGPRVQKAMIYFGGFRG